VAVHSLSRAPFPLADPRYVQASSRISGRDSRHALVCMLPLSRLVDSTAPPVLSFPGTVRTVDIRYERLQTFQHRCSRWLTPTGFHFTDPGHIGLLHIDSSSLVESPGSSSGCYRLCRPLNRRNGSFVGQTVPPEISYLERFRKCDQPWLRQVSDIFPQASPAISCGELSLHSS